MVTNLYEAGETLSTIMSIVKDARGDTIVQTPNGLAPVYWPYTIYGRTAMFDLNYYEKKIKGDGVQKDDPLL